MSFPAVWVTRPRPGNRRTANALARAGFTVVAVPVLQVNLTASPGSLPAAWPTWLVLISANAVRGLSAAERAGSLPAAGRSAVKVAVVGRRTAKEAMRAGWDVELVPREENARGLAEAFGDRTLAGASVWIPAGNREGSATRDLPAFFRSRGAAVNVIPVYETVPRVLGPDDLERLAGADPGAVVLHSPSSAEAVFGASASGPVRRWWGVPAACIGAATAGRCRELADIQILECKSPSDGDIVEVLSSIPSLVPDGKDMA